MTHRSPLHNAFYLWSLVLALIMFFGSGSTLKAAAEPECDHTIGKSVTKADGEGNYSDVRPGDIVCIAAGKRGNLVLQNFHGTEDERITFINSGGRVEIKTEWSIGIEVINSTYFRLTGSGSDDAYGIRVAKAKTVGVLVRDRSLEFEVDHIEVHDIGLIGIHAKTNGTCPEDGNAINRKTFEQRNSIFHNNYVHDVGTEGLYIGSSFYKGETLECADGPVSILPPRLVGVQVYNNIVERTGWDGIQVGSAMEECYIHHNTVRHDSLEDVLVQAASIIVNHGSSCDVYNNLIWEGNGAGIKIIGRPRGPQRFVYNNVIVRPGRGSMRGDNPGTGIIASTGRVNIWNNTIVEPKTIGIKYRNSATTANFQIANNIIVSPGKGDDGYIDIGNLTNARIFNNLLLPTINGDYSLLADSPAVDAGADLSKRGITIDHLGFQRPHGGKFDIGAFEYGSSSEAAQ
jgi:hypothetical protein